MIDHQTLCTELSTSTRKWWDKFNQKFGKTYPYPHLKFTLKGNIAGYANDQKNLIEYNVELYARYKKDFVKHTVPHEIAHLFAFKMYSNKDIKPHGNEWSRIMMVMGLEPTRCHNYDTTGLGKKKPFIYKCDCQTFHVTRVLHERMSNGDHRVCLKCAHRLVYADTVG